MINKKGPHMHKILNNCKIAFFSGLGLVWTNIEFQPKLVRDCSVSAPAPAYRSPCLVGWLVSFVGWLFSLVGWLVSLVGCSTDYRSPWLGGQRGQLALVAPQPGPNSWSTQPTRFVETGWLTILASSIWSTYSSWLIDQLIIQLTNKLGHLGQCGVLSWLLCAQVYQTFLVGRSHTG